ncbi:asparaginase [soil metagenome]
MSRFVIGAAKPPARQSRGVSVDFVEVVRSGFVECRHRGSAVALAADGEELLAYGDVQAPMFLRSCHKPLQATAMVRLGLDLPPPLLALVCSSHSGETMQVDGVRQILRGCGLTEGALQTPEDWPFDDDAREAVIREWGSRSSLLMNCSGKHAGMLATCVANGWPTDNYLDVDHPLQQAIARTLPDLTGEPVVHVAVDGCGAPLFSASLSGLARAFSRLALADADSAEGRVASAIRSNVAMVSGSRRDEAALLAAFPGAIGKAGAEGAYVVALADGRTVAVKIEDGAYRARPVAMAAMLQRLGLSHPVLDAQVRPPVLGGGRVVGELRAVQH